MSLPKMTTDVFPRSQLASLCSKKDFLAAQNVLRRQPASKLKDQWQKVINALKHKRKF
jgi:hypothetical protein